MTHTHDEEHYCDLHDWQTIGHVSSEQGVLAIANPVKAETLAARWAERVQAMSPLNREFPMLNYESHPLLTYEPVELKGTPGTHDWYDEEAIWIAVEQGRWAVEARFCNLYALAHNPQAMDICELRIRLHRHEEDR